LAESGTDRLSRRLGAGSPFSFEFPMLHRKERQRVQRLISPPTGLRVLAILHHYSRSTSVFSFDASKIVGLKRLFLGVLRNLYVIFTYIFLVGAERVVNLTVSMSAETVEKLRRTIRERYASRRGALSGLVEEAVLEALGRLETPTQTEKFRALKGDSIVAEADSLKQLASRLKDLRVDSRSVRIISSVHLAPVARAGFRSRKA